jgi:hypothetical protein
MRRFIFYCIEEGLAGFTWITPQVIDVLALLLSDPMARFTQDSAVVPAH